MTTISSRIQLINSYKPLLISKKKPLEKRIYTSKISLILNSIFLLVLLSYGYTSIILELIGFEGVLNWDKTGLILLLLIGNSINFQNTTYQYLLLRHIAFLKLSSVPFIEWEINENLQKIISQLNQTFSSKIAITGSSVLVILALLNYTQSPDLEFGHYFKIPFVIISIYFGMLFWNNYKQLIQNLIHVEIN